MQHNYLQKLCLSFSGAPSYEMMETDPDWVPSLKLGHSEVATSSLERHARCQRRSEVVCSSVEQFNADCEEESTDHVPKTQDAQCQTDLCASDIDKLESELLKLRQKENRNMNVESFENDVEKVNYFTALPSYFHLLHLFNFSKPHFPSKRVVSSFQMLMIVFFRLRLDLPIQFIKVIRNLISRR